MVKIKLLGIISVCGIIILESIALSKGIDGILLASSMTVIGGIAGYHFREKSS